MNGMSTLVLLLILVVAAIAIVLYLRSRAAAQREGTPPVDPLRKDSRGIDPRKLKVGDVVAVEGRDWVVRGTLHFDQDGFTWQEHHLDDTTTRRWLSVEDDEELEICLWEAFVAPELTPGGAEIEHDGVRWKRDEHGHARYRAEGTTGTPATGEAEYYDYTGDGSKRLSFERYGNGSWEVARGEVLNERSLDIYPSTA